MRVTAQSLFATLFPSDCRLCNAPLVNISRLPVCDECLARIAPARGPACAVCGERISANLQQPAAGELCASCRRVRPPYERALAYGPYDGALRDLIHLFKYGRVRPAARVLGRMLAEVIVGLEVPAERVLVVPVPLYRAKHRQRGFNQALETTRAALKLIAPAHPGKYELRPELLERVRETLSQTGLTRHQRRENMRGAFAAISPQQVDGRTVVLADDVFTTGTTVTECAKVLRRAGAGAVYVATIARVLRSEVTFADIQADTDSQPEQRPRARAAYA